MHTERTREQFIELRAQGWSLRHLASELHVGQRTLVDWNRECAAEIQALRAVELEASREKFLPSREEELNRLARLHKDVEDELANRRLRTVPTDRLFRVAAELRQELQQARLNDRSEEQFSRPKTNGHCDTATLETISKSGRLA